MSFKENPKKIAFAIISSHLGGAEKSLLQLLQPLSKNKNFVIHVLSPLKKGPLIDRIEELGIKVDHIPLPIGFLNLSRSQFLKTFLLLPWLFLASLYYLFRLRSFLKRSEFQVIHSTGIKNHILLGALSRFLNCKVVIHLRDIVSLSYIRLAFHLINNERIHWVSNSKVTQQSLKPISSQIIYNGFSFKEQNIEIKNPLSFKKQSGLFHLFSTELGSNQKVRIGIVGAIARWKGQREFIEMAKIVNQKVKTNLFFIVGSEIYDTGGDSGELAQLKKMVANYDLQEVVHFIPFQKQIHEIYGALDILVHASIKPEPFGRVIVEAAHNNCAIVAANSGGPLEMIESEHNGLLYEMGNPEAMAEAVLALVQDSTKLDSFKSRSSDVVKRFPLDQYVSDMTNIFS